MIKLFISKRLKQELPELWETAYGMKLEKGLRNQLLACVSTIHLRRVIAKKPKCEGISVYSGNFSKILGSTGYGYLDMLCSLPAGGEGEPLVGREPYRKLRGQEEGGESTRYKINSVYAGDIAVFKIEDETLEKRLQSIRPNAGKDRFYTDIISENVLQTLHCLSVAKSLTSFVEKTLETDCSSGSLSLTESDPKELKEQYRLICELSKIKGLEYLFFSRRTEHGSRLFHTFSNVRSEFRLFLRIDCEDTSEVDIGSSQPLMMLGLLAEHDDGSSEFSDELGRYKKTVADGCFYESLREYMHEHIGRYPPFSNASYKKFKKLVFKQIFYGRYNPNKVKRYMRAFQEMYPKLSEVLVSLKQGDEGHREFARKVQSIEASIVLDKVGEILIQEGIKFIPIHDSLIVPRSHTKRVKSLLMKTIQERIGIKPTLTVKNRRNK